MVKICQREHRQWDVVKRLLTSDAVGVEGMLTTSKKVSAHLVDMVLQVACGRIVGLKSHTDLEHDKFITLKGNLYLQPIVRL